MSVKLVTIPFSHYCEKARWALDIAGLSYQEEGHLPLVHYLFNRKYGLGRTVPGLVKGQEVLKDSSDIMHYCQVHGQYDLYPEHLNHEEITAWEILMNKVMGPHSRRWAYARMLVDDPLLMGIIRNFKSLESTVLHRLRHLLVPRVKAQMRQGIFVSAGSVAFSIQRVNMVLEKVETHLAKGHRYLVGDQFTAADLCFASLASPLVMPPEHPFPFPPIETYANPLKQDIQNYRERPAGQMVLRLYQDHR